MDEETVAQDPDGHADDYQVGWELTAAQLETLRSILARHTSSSDGWFLLWDGFGSLDGDTFAGVAKVRQPMRDYYLFQGPLSAYDQFPNPPSYWWPDDKAWCYSTDTDFAWAYIAGTRTCIANVLVAPTIDAIATKPDNPARYGMDILNRPARTTPPK
jgi:hypothetical protein